MGGADVGNAYIRFTPHRRRDIEIPDILALRAFVEHVLSGPACRTGAKARLMKEQHLSEPAAHRLLRRTAMNSGKRIVDIAADLLAETSKRP